MNAPRIPDDAGQVLKHVAVALATHAERARKQRLQLPAGFDALTDLLRALAASETATARQEPAQLGTTGDGPDDDVMPEARLLLRTADAAFALNVSQRTVERLIERGQLPAVQLGTVVRVPRAGLVEFVAALPSPCPAGRS